jgi:fatty acyl-ACP thioesterase B
LVPFYINRLSIAAEHNDVEKIDKLNNETAGRIRSGLAVSGNNLEL